MNKNRVRLLNKREYRNGPIIYWMSRDQRVNDNWALLFAKELAEQNSVSLAVVFSLRKKFPYATERMVDFMLTGLEEVEKSLAKKIIPFYFLLGDPEQEIKQFVNRYKIGAVVSDFSPLRYNREWKDTLSKDLAVPVYEVDTHNIVPCWKASDKQEFAAYTFRPKIHRVLSYYLETFPEVRQQTGTETFGDSSKTDWEKIRSEIPYDKNVAKVEGITPGEKAAELVLREFIEKKLKGYNEKRNDPNQFSLSELSPYLHFGQIAAQRVVLEVSRESQYQKPVDVFLEELIVRKELSDNFCYYNSNYNTVKGFPEWAKKTLAEHAEDKREFVYTKEDLEQGKTHDELWNAAQLEMVKRGKMHGYLRMYWAKKIMEWSPNISVALQIAQEFNDTYFLDGRDPNGYTGIAWSIGGVHDRPWFERQIFGKIRYMSYNGMRKKFDTTKYIFWVNSL